MSVTQIERLITHLREGRVEFVVIESQISRSGQIP